MQSNMESFKKCLHIIKKIFILFALKHYRKPGMVSAISYKHTEVVVQVLLTISRLIPVLRIRYNYSVVKCTLLQMEAT